MYIIHDVDALLELEQKAFIGNSIYYDANNSFLATIRHEALYAAFVLTKEKFHEDKLICEINSLDDLPESLDLWNKDLDSAVNLNGKLYPYGICLFNKWCSFDIVIINKSVNKKMINYVSEQIYLYHEKHNRNYYDALTELERKLFLFIATTDHSPSLDIEEMVSLKDEETSRMLKSLPNNNIMLGYHICDALVDRCIDKMNENSSLYKLYKSGSRFSKSQLSRSCIVIGYSANAENIVINKPIKSSLLEGLTEEQFFRVSPGTRKSIADKSKHTPSSGLILWLTLNSSNSVDLLAIGQYRAKR